ncbi:MAG: hypothetical protein GXY15_00125 [Candidatus Hydrogenedentes bacterium]|nr:hypothetical protein [Candidatus Hydrogenedentota bacterium]
MNPKTRALVWEEARVAGSIAAAMLAVGVFILASLRVSHGFVQNPWNVLGDTARAVVILLPALTALLLVLGMGNSGQMRAGGFPRRLLRLPVRTRMLVTLALVSRTALLLLVSGLLVLCANLLFGQRLDYSPVLLVAAGYLVIQLADWVRPVAPMLAVAAVAALAALLPQVDPLSLGIAGSALPWTALAAGGAVLAGAVWGLGLWMVDRHRHGETVRWLALPRWRDPWEGHWTPTAAPFKSPFAALFWFEMRRTSLFLPLATVCFWVLGAALIAGLQWWVGDEDHMLAPPEAQEILFQMLSFAALMLAAFMWQMIFHRPDRASKGKRRFAGPSPVVPVPPGALGSARLAVAALNLALALGIAWTVQVVHFLVLDGGVYGEMLSGGLAEGTVNFREAVIVLLGPGLVVAGTCWALMTTPYGIMGLLFMAQHLILMFAPERVWVPILILTFFALQFPAVFLAGAWEGHYSRRTTVGVMAFWVLMSVALYPFSKGLPEAQVVNALLCLGVSGALAACWPSSLGQTWAIGRRGMPLLYRFERPDCGHRKATPTIPRGLAVAAVAALCLAAWLRWPFEPAWRRDFRAQGLPVTLEEFEAAYPPVPKAENLADRLLDAARAAKEMEEAWVRTLPEYGDPGWNPQDRQLIRGKVLVERREKVTADALKITAAYHENVGRHVSAMVHEAVTSGLTRSRYSLSFRRGYGPDSRDPFSALFDLFQIQSLEAFLAVMEGRNQDAVTALTDILGMADSVRQEPLHFAQMIHGDLLGWAASNAQRLLNRTVLGEEELVRLQEALSRALPPEVEGPFRETALYTETILQWDYWERIYGLPGVTEQLVMIDYFRKCRDHARKALDRRVLSDFPRWNYSSSLFPRTSFLPIYVSGPHLAFSYEREFSCRTWVSLARTALAVERFRGATGRLPERLDDLVPEWLDEVPADYWNDGEPLSYRVREDGAFVVYSYGENRTDNGGVEVDTNWRRDGDVTFTVAPPEARAELRMPAAAEAAS